MERRLPATGTNELSKVLVSLGMTNDMLIESKSVETNTNIMKLMTKTVDVIAKQVRSARLKDLVGAMHSCHIWQVPLTPISFTKIIDRFDTNLIDLESRDLLRFGVSLSQIYIDESEVQNQNEDEVEEKLVTVMAKVVTLLADDVNVGKLGNNREIDLLTAFTSAVGEQFGSSMSTPLQTALQNLTQPFSNLHKEEKTGNENVGVK